MNLIIIMLLYVTSGVKSDVPPTIQQISVQHTGDIQSQNYPSPLSIDKHDAFVLSAPFGYRIGINFLDLDIPESDWCSSASVTVFEQDQGPPYVIACGTILPKSILSRGNQIIIVVRTDNSTQSGRGFRLRYSPQSVAQTFCPFGEVECHNRNCFSLLSRCNGQDNCQDGTDEENCLLQPNQPFQCTPNTSIDPAVSFGHAIPHSFPWLVSLELNYFSPSGHICSGALIHPNYILTTGSCLAKYWVSLSSFRISFGKNTKFDTSQPVQTRTIKRAVIHPNVNVDRFTSSPPLVPDSHNDIALVRLNAPILISNEVQPICLPLTTTNFTDNLPCFASGWNASPTSNVLQFGLDFGSQEGCAESGTMECANSVANQEGTCSGDVGSPVGCRYDATTWLLRGLTADPEQSGSNCPWRQTNTRFVSILHNVDWIQQQMTVLNNGVTVLLNQVLG